MRTFFIIVEALQKIEKFILVPPEDSLDLRWFLRICDEHLLNTLLAVSPQQIKNIMPTLNTWNASN